MAGAGSMYDRVGGRNWFEALVGRFYQAVESDPVLRPLYPAEAERLAAARDHLCSFLVQYWGGPADYSAARGHPRLRMRHAGLRIGPVEAGAWYRLMADSVRAGGLGPDDEDELLAYLSMAATHMINAG
jgi:hemoglobin